MEELDAQNDDYSAVIVLLESHIAEYLELGEKMKIEVDGEDVLDVIDRVIFKANGQEDPGPEGDTPKDFFLDGLFEELSGEPKNLFEQVVDADGNQQYAPFSHEAWTTCLGLLRASVEKMTYGT